MDEHITYIGLDVQKETISVALAVGGRRGEVREHGQISITPSALTRLLSKRSQSGAVLRFCYEAGSRMDADASPVAGRAAVRAARPYIVLEDCMSTIEAATAGRDRPTAQIEAMLVDWAFAPVVHALQALRGMALVTAATVIAELGVRAA